MIDFVLSLNRWHWLLVYLGFSFVAAVFVGQFLKAGKGPDNRRWYD